MWAHGGPASPLPEDGSEGELGTGVFRLFQARLFCPVSLSTVLLVYSRFFFFFLVQHILKVGF